eukprot:2601518-Amphidinium_carterae.1
MSDCKFTERKGNRQNKRAPTSNSAILKRSQDILAHEEDTRMRTTFQHKMNTVATEMITIAIPNH